MPNAFEEADKELKSSGGAGGAGGAFEQADSELKKEKRLTFGQNVGQALSHTWAGINPLNVLGPVVDAPMALLPGIAGQGARNRLYQGFVEPTVTGAKEAMAAYDKGDYGTAALEAAKAIPIVGQPIVGGAERAITTGNWGAPLGDAAAFYLSHKAIPTVKKGLIAAGEHTYESALSPRTTMSLADREAIVQRGLSPEGRLRINSQSLIDLGVDSKQFRDQVQYLTKDPSSPFSQKTVPIDTILAPVDTWITELRRAKGDKIANEAQAMRDHWAKELGYQPAQQVPMVGTGPIPASSPGSYGPQAVTQPGVTNIPAVTHATVADIQTLKESLNRVVKSSAYNVKTKMIDAGVDTVTDRAALGGMQRAVESQVSMVKGLNNAIHTDLMLKDAMDHALRRNPNWTRDWAPYIVGSGTIDALMAGGEHLNPVILGGAIARTILKHPEGASRLAIALHATGVAIPAWLQKLADVNSAVGISKAAGEQQRKLRPTPQTSAIPATPDIPDANNSLFPGVK